MRRHRPPPQRRRACRTASGTELADAVREARPGTPTLFVCGYTADALADRGVRVDGLDMLAKPYNGVELATRVRRVLDARPPAGRRPRPPPDGAPASARPADRRSCEPRRTRLHSGRDAAQSNEDAWRAMLAPDNPSALALRRVFRRIPSPPRCKMCHAPFGGIGGFVLRPWFGPWEKNPQLCKACIGALAKQGPGGAEVEISLLFADIRGSTAIGERLRPTEFSALLHAFYRIAAAAIADHEGIVDKFVGDEAIGLFIPGFAGRDHAAKAIACRPRAAGGGRQARRLGVGPDPGGRRHPHRRRLRRQRRRERRDLRLHRAGRRREHDRAARVARGARASSSCPRTRRRTRGSRRTGWSGAPSTCADGRPVSRSS